MPIGISERTRWVIAAGVAGVTVAAFALSGAAVAVSIGARLLDRADVGGSTLGPLTLALGGATSLAATAALAPSGWRARVAAVGVTIATGVTLFAWLALTFSDSAPGALP